MYRNISWLVAGIVILIFLAYNFYFSVNFPFQDDFLLIQFIEAISVPGLSLKGFFNELFMTFNDHKAVVLRLISFVEYLITGHLNFRFYIFLVSVNLIYVFYFVYLQFRKTRLPFYYFLPALFLFFQPLFHDVSGWAVTGLQHSFLTAFTVTAIILVSRGGRLAFTAAMLCCFLATFTHGNGILSFPAIIFFFLCHKDFKKVGVTALVMFVSLGIYLIGYESGQAMNLPTSVVNFVSHLFGFIGSSMSLWAQPVLWSAVWGGLIVAFMAFLVVRVAGIYFNKEVSVNNGTIELLSCFIFILISSFVISLFRSWAGVEIASRFQLYASLSSVIFYVLLLDYHAFFRKTAVFYTVFSLSIFYWAYSYYKYTHVVANKRVVYLADVYNWENNRDMFSVEKTIVRNAEFYLLPAYEKGFFKLPAPVVNKEELDSMYSNVRKPIGNFEMFIEIWKAKRTSPQKVEYLSFFSVESDKLPQHRGILTDRFLVLRSKSNGVISLISGNPKVETRKVILTKGRYYKNGFNVTFKTDDLNPGVYELGILDISITGKKKFYRLDKSLRQMNGSYTLE